MKKCWFLLLAAVSFLYGACSDGSGLGEAIDLEAPVIGISSLTSGEDELTNFSGSVYCNRNVTFKGTATDNKAVTRVYAELKWAEEETFSYLSAATLSGDIWTCDLAFEKEGVAIIRFVAEDERNNISPKSSKTSILFIDEDAPVASAWYIDRLINGIHYNLRDLDSLKKIANNLDSAENIDAAQNVTFSLRANVNDTFSVGSVALRLKDENGALVCSIKNTSGNDYAPEFVVTQDDIVKGAISNGLEEDFSTGIHYLQVSYDAQDLVPNIGTDMVVDEGWLIWYPESDIPKITPSETVVEDIIPLHIKDVLSLSIFDDDELKEAYCALLTEEESASFTVNWDTPATLETAITATGDEKDKRFKHFEAQSGERDTTVVLYASDTPQDMHLYAYAVEAATGKTITKDIIVRVTDDTQPILLITSPDNNSVPAVQMNDDNTKATVTIQGQSLDSVGCDYLEFVWLPEAIAEESTQKAKDWLSSLSDTQHASYKPTGTDTSKKIEGTGEYAGLTLWSVALSDITVSGNFMKQEFSFDVDLLSDFGDERAKSKTFVARLLRKDGNNVFAEYRLLADTAEPTIVPVYPATDMQIISVSEDLVLEFKAEKTSGLAINPDSYKIFLLVDLDTGAVLTTPLELGTDYNAHYDSDSKTYKATIPHTKLKMDVKPRFEFHATDIFGNEGKDRYTVVVDTAPLLKSITTTASESVMHKMGENIIITATFSNTVSVKNSESGKLKLKLTNIKNDNKSQTVNDIVYADYTGGSGSTTLTFTYTVQEGDDSDGIKLVETKTDNKYVNLFETTETTSFVANANVTAISDESKLFSTKKTIKLDGIPPKAETITIETDATESNKHDDITYLGQGKKIVVTVTADDYISVQGTPTFVFTTATDGNLILKFAGSGSDGKSVKFETKVVTGYDGVLTYSAASCVGFESIVDTAGNALSTVGVTLPTDKITIDTIAPANPIVTKADGTALVAGKYNTGISFKMTAAETGNILDYSLDGGSTYTDYDGNVIPLSPGDGQLTIIQLAARATDYAGNQSTPAIVDLYLNDTFPAFSVECTNPDGYYKAGSSLTFKVTFESKVNISANAAAQLTLSKRDESESIGSTANPGVAKLTSTVAQTGVSVAYFTYQIQDPDQFTLLVPAGAAIFTGITDEYGNAQGSQTNAVYERPNIHCDGVAPKVTSMTPLGTETTSTADGAKVYTQGNKIVLTFSEEIQIASGNLTLRQIKDWPIPPVLSASDFSTITAAISTDEKEILSMQKNGIDMEDSESLFQAKVGPANDRYHGTGQYVGPYKKSMQGLTLSNGSYVPDTSVKYVLDFDIGIWETDTTHPIGQTFESGHLSGNDAADAYSRTSTTGLVKVVEPTTTRTAGQIRNVLEKAGYHERVVDVTSSYVALSSDKKTVTVTFPKGLTGSAALSDGRKWELVIDKGAFMDTTGNYFGAEPNGDLAQSDAIQNATSTPTQTTVTTARGRLRTSVTDGSAPVVLVQNGGKDYFWSDKVATPVVRVDRYSYALGMYQSDANGKRTAFIPDDETVPTGYVRVRIDCETDGATVTYNKDGTSNVRTDETFNSTTDYNSPDSAVCHSYISATTDLTESVKNAKTLGLTYTKDSVFACGNGDYTKSYKQYVIAAASKGGLTNSERGIEGIYQTVVHFVAPYGDTGSCGAQAEGKNNVSIRGTTGFAGEPYISPFPLRDSQIASPFLRRTYRVALPSPTKTLTKKVTSAADNYWGNTQIVTASELRGVKAIRISVTTTSGNFGVKGGTNTNNKYWSNDASFSNAVLSSTIVNEAVSNGLYVEGSNNKTYTCIIECYDTSLDPYLNYYWVGYDILVESSFSMYSWHKNNYYDWGKNWGLMRPGEFTRCTNMRNWG